MTYNLATVSRGQYNAAVSPAIVFDGATDCGAAFNSYIQSTPVGSEIILPGSIYTTVPIVVSNGRSLTGAFKGSTASGGDVAIIGSATVSPIVQLTAPDASRHGSQQNLRFIGISRVGTVSGGIGVTAGSGLVGLQLDTQNMSTVQDCWIYNNDVGIQVLGVLGTYFERVSIWACATEYVYISNSVETRFTNCRLGRNGTQNVNGSQYFHIDGSVPNTLVLIGCQLNGGYQDHAFAFTNYTGAGEITLDATHIEGLNGANSGGSSIFYADGSTTQLLHVSMNNCSINTRADFGTGTFYSGPTGLFHDLRIIGCTLGFALNLVSIPSMAVVGNYLQQAITLTSCSGTFVGNECLSTLTISGTTGLCAYPNIVLGAITDTSSGSSKPFMGNLSATTLVATGAISGTTLTGTGAISGTNVTASSGTVTVGGNAISGPQVIINGNANNRALRFQNASRARFTVFVDASAENNVVVATSIDQGGAGTLLTFTSTTGVATGMFVWGTNIAPSTTVSSFTATTVTLSLTTTGNVAIGTSVTFGTNAGSSFGIQDYNDDGSTHTVVLAGNRATQNATFGYGVTLSSALTLKTSIITSGASYTVLSTDQNVIINKGTGSATAVTLPTSPSTGRSLTVKDGKGDAATNNITITPAAGNIDGSATAVINTNYGVWRGIYNGTQWNTI